MYLLLLKLEERSVRPSSFRKTLNHIGRTQSDCCIPQVALQSPKDSSFVKLYESCDHQALTTLTGFDHATFIELHNMFAPVFNAFTLYSCNENGSYLKVNKTQGGCPHSVDSKICLAIVLSWTCTCSAS